MKYITTVNIKKDFRGGGEEVRTISHIVNAESEAEAESKVRKHYEDKSDMYYTRYIIREMETSEEIS